MLAQGSGGAHRHLIQLERRGFTRWAWSIVHLERTVDMCVQPVLPPGFSIAPGSAPSPDSWAALHRAVFPRLGMSAEWRRGIMRSIDYGSNLRPHNARR